MASHGTIEPSGKLTAGEIGLHAVVISTSTDAKAIRA